MPATPFRLALLCLFGFGLAACDEAALTGTGMQAPAPVAEAPAPIDPALYAARQDGNFNIPAVPVEKLDQKNARQFVDYPTDQPVGTIIINPSERFLYLVTGPNQAKRYGISVGRSGFEWHGEAIISARRNWPTWTPPPEMIDRDPKLEKWKDGQPGGPSNPLGARALYLTTNGRDYGYRIHGTPDWWSIGRNASSGCIRMIHQDVIDLAERVPNGTKVIVLTRDGQMPKGLKVPPPAPRKPKPAEVEPVAAALPVPTDPAVVQDPASAPTPAALGEPAATPDATTQPPTLPEPPASATVPTEPVTAPAAAVAPLVSTAPETGAATPAQPVVVPPASAPAEAPASAPAACKVPLVNGVCPQP